MSADTAFLTVKNINKRFVTKKTSLTVIDDVSFSQRQGEIVTVVGASGSGKTTLLRIIAGLEVSDSGEVHLDGALVTKPCPTRSMVFQQAGLMPWLTVEQNVRFGIAALKLSDEEMQHRVQDVIQRVRLAGFENFYPKQLSGGMQQRVGIARALAAKPKLLLCDEPFASIDAMTRQVMQSDLQNVVAQEGTSALLVTHDIEEAIYLGDRIVVLSSRPARLLEIITVELPKSREHSMRGTAYFQDLKEKIWNRLHE
jgi:ABC-type nitrate/sulfonate/bicarbonate transport system ATPase subunit